VTEVGPRESLHLFGLPGLANVGRVSQGVYRGADPAPGEGYRSLAQLGIRTILNLSRGRDHEAVKPYGISEVYMPVDFFRDVDEGEVRRILMVISDASLYPIFVHCAQGRDRTGIVIACHRINRGWSTKDAIDEMWSCGFHFVWSHFLDFVRDYRGGNHG